MSRLFGPFSVTRSSVSLRDWALADKTAGAVTVSGLRSGTRGIAERGAALLALVGQELQLLRLCEIESDQPAGTGPLVPGCASLGVGGQLPEPRSGRLDLGW